jgi:hypothetical protein
MSEFTAAGGGIEHTADASNIQRVTAGDIHSGKEGKNGPVIVTLLKKVLRMKYQKLAL